VDEDGGDEGTTARGEEARRQEWRLEVGGGGLRVWVGDFFPERLFLEREIGSEWNRSVKIEAWWNRFRWRHAGP
jgi:hypothetical protein